MKIEEGKYYRTRDGRKVGPMERSNSGANSIYWHCGKSIFGMFTSKWSEYGYSYEVDGLDLISEWKDEAPSPIRTVTRKEIVPGPYGIVQVTSSREIKIQLGKYNSDKLREAAHILNQIAEALEDD